MQQVHAAIQREKREPRVGLEPLSFWLIASLRAGAFSLAARISGATREISAATVLDPSAAFRRRRKAAGPGGGSNRPRNFHQPIAAKRFLRPIVRSAIKPMGSARRPGYPPLAGSEITNGGSRRAAMIVLKGLQGPITVKGQQFGTAVMQPWESLTDQKIADVLTYERQEWGNKGSPVTEEQIAALRKELAISSRIICRSRSARSARREFARRRGGCK